MRRRGAERIMPMQVTVEMPDDIARQLGEGGEMPRQLLEALAADAHRSQKLSRHQVSQLLDLDYWQTEEFLAGHDAKRTYTDPKSTRLNSSHLGISYAVFCLKKK